MKPFAGLGQLLQEEVEVVLIEDIQRVGKHIIQQQGSVGLGSLVFHLPVKVDIPVMVSKPEVEVILLQLVARVGQHIGKHCCTV